MNRRALYRVLAVALALAAMSPLFLATDFGGHPAQALQQAQGGIRPAPTKPVP